MQIIWSPRAVDDFEILLISIAKQNPQNAALVRDRIIKSVGLLTDFQFGQAGPIEGTYIFYIPKTSYFVIYRPKNLGLVEIVAFFHASQNWINVNAMELDFKEN